jgi:hypothetical protein
MQIVFGIYNRFRPTLLRPLDTTITIALPRNVPHSFDRTMFRDLLENHGCSVNHVNAITLHCVDDICLHSF